VREQKENKKEIRAGYNKSNGLSEPSTNKAYKAGSIIARSAGCPDEIGSYE